VAAVLDTSSIPVPMDVFIAGWVWTDRGHFWLYCLLASAGSAIGGLVPYGLGRAGGELFLLKHVNREHYEKIRARFAAAAPAVDFPEARHIRREGRELELTVNGHSEEILRRLQALAPEELTTETLTLEEIFVAALK